MYDVYFIADKGIYKEQYNTIKKKIPIAKFADSLFTAQRTSLTKFFWVVYPDIEIDNNFDFSYTPDEWSQKYIHVFKNGDSYDGISLVPKDAPISTKEIEYRFYTNKKEVDILASNPKPFDIFEIESFADYEYAMQNSTTDLFWMSSANIFVDNKFIRNFYINHHEKIDRYQNHNFIHNVYGKEYRNGLFLLSKHRPITKKEIDYRFIVNCKEWDIVGSGPVKYQVYNVSNYIDYQNAVVESPTEMFYVIPDNVEVDDSFTFNHYFEYNNEYDRQINHTFLNGKYNDGIILCSKYAKIHPREWEFKFLAHKKDHDELASSPKPYDMVFISYQEPNAEENYKKICKRFPQCKRVHGVKGIHQAHIEAAKLCSTEMLWIIDGDAVILDDFDFDYQAPAWQYDHVHVWRSKNPVNNLIYGYGGVKLFPRELTLNMDVNKPDMTTSISAKFKPIQLVSNITGFNTDPFNTWKSAFRECAKLSSKIIDRQKTDETDERLTTWSTVGKDKPFGEYAIKGAKEGMMYGSANRGNVDALKKINDFDWLREQFNGDL
jgi:hypothetical protein